MVSFRDILRKTTLYNRLKVIIDDGQTSWLRGLGKNDFYHSKNVETLLDRMVPDDLKNDEEVFDHGEIFFLLAAVYLHDIGRKSPEGYHELETYEMIKGNPEAYNLQNSYVAKAVAEICAAHAPESVWPIERCDRNYGIAGFGSTGRPFNLQRLGALLRIADELDTSYVRIQGIVGQWESPRNIIRFVNPIPNKRVIEIQAEPNSWEEWDKLVRFKDHAQARVREVKKYLEDIGLDYYQIWLRPQKFFAPLMRPGGPLNNYDDMVESVAVLTAGRFTKVELFEEIEQSEISVLCTEMRLGNSTKTAIIVRENLTENSAYEIRGFLSHLIKEGYIHHGVVVIGEVIDNTALSILTNKNGFPVYTFDNLVSELYDFSSAINNYISEYEKKEIFLRNLYISLTADSETGENLGSIEEYILEWAKKNEGVHLTVLGDFGAGKTTICERIIYKFAKEFLLKPTKARIPLLLRLKEFGSNYSIEAAITNLFVNQLGIELPYTVFEKLNKAGRFVIILDGFDEIPNLTSENAVLRAFRELDNLAEQNAKVVLTCRTHFFKNNVEIHNIHEGSALYESIEDKYGYQLLFINNLEEAQIWKYIELWYEAESACYIDTIRTVYNLSDLAKRPALLNIIAQTVPQLHSIDIGTVNAASLYELYISFWLERDDWRSELDMHERRFLAESVSEYIFLNNFDDIHYSKLPTLFDLWVQKRGAHRLEILDYELRTCNFLRRDHLGNYNFVHRSFLEYLMAKKLFREIIDEPTNLFPQWFLPLEISEKNIDRQNIASLATQEFFLQLLENWQRSVPIRDIPKLLRDRRRAQVLVVKGLISIGRRDYGTLCADMIIDPNFKISTEFLAIQIMQSLNRANALARIKDAILSQSNLEHLKIVILALHSIAGKEHDSEVEELDDILAQIEESREFSAEKEDIDRYRYLYPYTRKNAKEKLANLLHGISDENAKDKIRQDFRRQWYREKAEYDKSLRVKIREAAKEQKQSFQNDLKQAPKRK